ncbi:MAG: helix-turn-helix transcriptional regulator [Chitinispirillales bacterium]|jgi:transcriptional regulator with XRE-family HTH domain|nr:helix-turn-helix transcriptional regulator [Chitinispirillales bacterium]
MSANERIKELRKSLGLTQAEFGRKVGIVQGHITGIESGSRPITEKTVKVISVVYGVSESWLKTGKGNMYSKNRNRDKVIRQFNELNPLYQDFILSQFEWFLELQRNITRENRSRV